MPDSAALASYLDNILEDATVPGLPGHYRGKVRENYDLPDGRRILVATDRLSAFDVSLTEIPLKGQVLTQLARFWFDRTRDIWARGRAAAARLAAPEGAAPGPARATSG